jgi:hypothetical protein
MKVVFHEDFYRHYNSDPAAEPGRMEAVMEAVAGRVDLVTPRSPRISRTSRRCTPNRTSGT